MSKKSDKPQQATPVKLDKPVPKDTVDLGELRRSVTQLPVGSGRPPIPVNIIATPQTVTPKPDSTPKPTAPTPTASTPSSSNSTSENK